jgi:hypothetical protein
MQSSFVYSQTSIKNGRVGKKNSNGGPSGSVPKNQTGCGCRYSFGN